MLSTTTLQRLEGAVVFSLSVWLYHLGQGTWWLFVLLLFTADVTIAGYVWGDRVGAHIYNLGHSYVLPGIIALFFLFTSGRVPPLLFIWFAHIGLDRLMGYGLKLPTGFKHTHLGRIGK